VRMVAEVVVVDPQEAEDEAGGPLVARRVTQGHETTVVHDREHELRRNDDVAAPGFFLQGNRPRARRDVLRHLDAELGHRCEVSASIPRVPASIDFLKRVSWFEDLDQRSLDSIANAAVEQQYQPGQEIVRQGDTGVGAFIIRSGKVEIVQERNGKETKLTTLGPGDVFGEMALLDEFPRSATARAVEPTTCLGLQRWHFKGILESHPQIALALLPILTRRIRKAEGMLPEAVRH
jgi:CRP/FNR family transcriptional regulator, cyclic AMP receptor protein